MTTISSKVCVVGDFAVGKTSVIERFVNNQFSDKYLTTVGVKIDTTELEFEDLGVHHKLVIWDVAGSDRFSHAEFAYLRGASGYLFVADGTRPDTLRAIEDLRSQINEQYGDKSAVLLVNKNDLKADFAISDDTIAALAGSFDYCCTTSAKTGDNVEQAIARLARRIIENDLQA